MDLCWYHFNCEKFSNKKQIIEFKDIDVLIKILTIKFDEQSQDRTFMFTAISSDDKYIYGTIHSQTLTLK